MMLVCLATYLSISISTLPIQSIIASSTQELPDPRVSSSPFRTPRALFLYISRLPHLHSITSTDPLFLYLYPVFTPDYHE